MDRNLRARFGPIGVRTELVANDAGGNPDAVLLTRDGVYSPLLWRHKW